MPIETIISSLCSVLVAVIGGVFVLETHKHRKAAEKSEEREKLKEEEAVLQLELDFASVQLAVVTAKKVANQHVNGELEKSLKEAECILETYRKFIRRHYAENLATRCEP